MEEGAWYVHGEYVLDRLIGVLRCETVDVHFTGTPPPAEAVRDALNIPPTIELHMDDGKLRQLMTLDQLVMQPSGEFYDLVHEDVATPPDLPLRVVLVTFELSTTDLLRLARLRRGYPELVFDELLAARIQSSISHLESVRTKFPDLEVMFMNSEPFTPWRAE